MYDVIQNVELPPIRRANRRRRRKYPFETMNIGDMFFVPTKTRNLLTTQAASAAAQLGWKFSTRSVTMKQVASAWVMCDETDPDATAGIGVWRIA